MTDEPTRLFVGVDGADDRPGVPADSRGNPEVEQ